MGEDGAGGDVGRHQLWGSLPVLWAEAAVWMWCWLWGWGRAPVGVGAGAGVAGRGHAGRGGGCGAVAGSRGGDGASCGVLVRGRPRVRAHGELPGRGSVARSPRLRPTSLAAGAVSGRLVRVGWGLGRCRHHGVHGAGLGHVGRGGLQRVRLDVAGGRGRDGGTGVVLEGGGRGRRDQRGRGSRRAGAGRIHQQEHGARSGPHGGRG